MPQGGFHALIGVTVGRRVWPGRADAVLGFTLGSMLPDVDVLPFAILAVTGHVIPALHRTLTHSLVTATVVLAAGWVVRRRVAGVNSCPTRQTVGAEARRFSSVDAGSFLVALAVGMAGHDLLDIFFWLTSIDLFWPISRFLGWPEVNIWRWYQEPAVFGNRAFVGNELAALEAFGTALYLGYVLRLAQQAGEGGKWLRIVLKVRMTCWILFPIFVITGAVWRMEYQELAVYTPNILLFYPVSFWATVVFRRALVGKSRWEQE